MAYKHSGERSLLGLVETENTVGGVREDISGSAPAVKGVLGTWAAGKI